MLQPGFRTFGHQGQVRFVFRFPRATLHSSAPCPTPITPPAPLLTARWCAGLYDNLQKYHLPTPTAVFDIEYFRENPRPFFELSKELYPGRVLPTTTHYFLRLLADKGVLERM